MLFPTLKVGASLTGLTYIEKVDSSDSSKPLFKVPSLSFNDIVKLTVPFLFSVSVYDKTLKVL